MSDDIRGLLGRALGDDIPPSTTNTDELESRGASAARRRGWGIAGGATTVVAAATAGILILPGVFAGADPAPAGRTRNGGTTIDAHPDAALALDPADQPEFPLPELDPGTNYVWQNMPVYPGDEDSPEPNSGSNDETVAMSDELWTWFADNLPDMQLLDAEGNPMDPEDYPGFDRAEFGLQEAPADYPYYMEWPGENEYLGDPVPFYTLAGMDPGLGTGLQFDRSGDAATTDGLNITVHPRGSFVEGTGDLDNPLYHAVATPKLLPGCEGYTADFDGSLGGTAMAFECFEETGPNGEHIQRVGMTMTGEDDVIVMKANIIMVTLNNGNAVVASDEIWNMEMSDESDLTDDSPALDLDALTDLVMALPQVVVQ